MAREHGPCVCVLTLRQPRPYVMSALLLLETYTVTIAIYECIFEALDENVSGFPIQAIV